MEGSESEGIFSSLNLNPQLFINETLNTVDDLLEEALFFFHEESSTLLKTDATHRSTHLIKGIDQIREIIQADLDKNLGIWERHCMRYIFNVPQGFSLPENNDEVSGESSMDHDALENADVDAQLDFLRNKLSMAERETRELNRELRALERQSALKNQCTESINEVLEMYEKHSGTAMFQEMIRTASELRKKTEKLENQRMEEFQQMKTERIYNSNNVLCPTSLNKGFYKAKVKDLEDFHKKIREVNMMLD